MPTTKTTYSMAVEIGLEQPRSNIGPGTSLRDTDKFLHMGEVAGGGIDQTANKPRDPFMAFGRLEELIGKDSEGYMTVAASNGEKYQNAFFVRDTLTCLDLLWRSLPENMQDYNALLSRATVASDSRPQIDSNALSQEHRYALKVHGIIRELSKTMVRYQGTRSAGSNPNLQRTGEELGKFHHELRLRSETGNQPSDKVFGDVDRLWGEQNPEHPDVSVNYHNIDSTLRFVSFMAEYVHAGGNYDLLDERVEHYRGGDRLVGEGLLEGVAWIERKLQESSTGFIEYARGPGQEHAIRNQVWKDSLNSYMHESGELANTNAPVAPVAEQGMVFDSFMNLFDMFLANQDLARQFSVEQSRIERWQFEALNLRDRFLREFWMPDSSYFAMGRPRFAQGLDHDPTTGRVRKITTATSDQFHLLRSRIFEGLDEHEQQTYITALVKQIASDDFLTKAGVRCRARCYDNIVDFVDYHGSNVTWLKETAEIAEGLAKWGFLLQADDLMSRIKLVDELTDQDDPEFVFVGPNGDVYVKCAETDMEESFDNGPVFYSTTTIELHQAWTAAAVQRADISNVEDKLDNTRPKTKPIPQWVLSLDGLCHDRLPSRPFEGKEVALTCWVNKRKAQELEMAWLKASTKEGDGVPKLPHTG